MNRTVSTPQNSTGYKSAQYYDLINSAKDYEREVTILRERIAACGIADGANLLDVACGSGQHLSFLQKFYRCEGLDIDPEFVAIASKKLSGEVHTADMVSFDFDARYDVITCLFSSIGYVKTAAALQRTIANMSRHLKPSGLLIIEPWYTVDTFLEGYRSALLNESAPFKVARMNYWRSENGISLCDSHILAADNAGIHHIQERHELGLFTDDQYESAFLKAGLDVSYDKIGLTGRGLYFGNKKV